MKKVKKIVAGALLTAALLSTSGVGVFASEAGCDHNWNLYHIEKVYEYSGVCKEHENCYAEIEGYFARYKCGKCGEEDAHTYTEERHLR